MSRLDAILLLGPTGAGKTPLGELLERRGLWGRRCVHFDFGAEMRRIVAGGAPPGSVAADEVAFLAEVLRTGALLEDEHFPLAAKVLRGFLRRCGVAGGEWVVLNGLPRHVGQAEDMDAIVNVRAVVHLACPMEVAMERVRSNVGGDRDGRTDDGRDAVRRKLEVFAGRTAELLEHYTRRGTRIETVPVGPDTTAESVRAALEARRPPGGPRAQPRSC